MRTVSELRDAVGASLGDGDLVMLSIRVMIATGVSLKSPKPEHDRNPASVERVRKALADLGVTI